MRRNRASERVTEAPDVFEEMRRRRAARRLPRGTDDRSSDFAGGSCPTTPRSTSGCPTEAAGSRSTPWTSSAVRTGRPRKPRRTSTSTAGTTPGRGSSPPSRSPAGTVGVRPRPCPRTSGHRPRRHRSTPGDLKLPDRPIADTAVGPRDVSRESSPRRGAGRLGHACPRQPRHHSNAAGSAARPVRVSPGSRRSRYWVHSPSTYRWTGRAVLFTTERAVPAGLQPGV